MFGRCPHPRVTRATFVRRLTSPAGDARDRRSEAHVTLGQDHDLRSGVRLTGAEANPQRPEAVVTAGVGRDRRSEARFTRGCVRDRPPEAPVRRSSARLTRAGPPRCVGTRARAWSPQHRTAAQGSGRGAIRARRGRRQRREHQSGGAELPRANQMILRSLGKGSEGHHAGATWRPARGSRPSHSLEPPCSPPRRSSRTITQARAPPASLIEGFAVRFRSKMRTRRIKRSSR